LAGIGLDSSVVPLRYGNLSLIQTTDFFYPLVDSPYIMVCIMLCCLCYVHNLLRTLTINYVFIMQNMHNKSCIHSFLYLFFWTMLYSDE